MIELQKGPRKVEITLNYQRYIDGPPAHPKALYQQSCSNDEVTISSWKPVWIANAKANFEKYGSFTENSIGEIFNKFLYKPVIVAGSGPSLKYNGLMLKHRGGIGLVSCLHNFHYMIDNEIPVDYFVSLDAGEITIEEVYEGGKHPPEYYWERTKDQTLLCYLSTSPRLLEKWQGKVLFFNCAVPDASYMEDLEKLEPFRQYVGTGGNVLGACMYISKAFLGASAIVFTGADFSFSYDSKFHGWDSKYDATLGNTIETTDVFGIKVKTWQSYHNFKCWFDYITLVVPGLYINASEGGCLGSYNEGNIRSILQMPLADCINMFNMSEHVKEQVEKPKEAEKKLLF
jgi:hypothetical protein